jgi:hypothetical protein
MDSAELRTRAARLRNKATALDLTVRRGITDLKMIDAYTALIAEYDTLALQLDRMADDFRQP